MSSNRLALLLVLLLPACGPDADMAVDGGGVVAKGWTAQPDKAEAGLQHVRFTHKDGVYELNVGPGLILYKPEHTAKPPYKLSVRVEQLDSKGHAHGAGLILGGRDLGKKTQVYTYILVRGDGKYIVKTRDGDKTNELSPKWPETTALNKEDKDGHCSNLVEVDVGKEKTVFSINGKPVFEHLTKSLYADGICGLRANHNLRLRFSELKTLQQ